MATLSVWKFDTADGAEKAEHTLEGLAKQELLTLHDGAIVSWPEGKKKPKTRQLHSMVGLGAVSGSFWGLLFGILFFMPLLGLVIGAASGALAGSMTDVGIDDDFIADLRDKITPGTSALFIMTTDVVVDKVHQAFAGTHAELLHTNLSSDEEAKLKEVFFE